ncbi:ketopantoate reductase family protein [Marinobacter sp. 2_MG-2023]|uniref:ketopantoate reductase family protein n=1 Tax=Marinobacter sp. 2_MG-2023 TaxID=3062679 RepID=UPI0026E27506|nr:2-dehydropantoate 2-reductase [Marinobacter sp. 2_MG-2023]MDO6443317.1 2-dehydropantoate 2-reductase [Marinobacter sp. 2_MG-2023]
MLSILMIGAGGIGGYYGARLSEAGHRIVLTARGAHLAALEKKGLVVHYEGRQIECSVPAVDHAALMQNYQPGDFDVIVFALKSTATKAVLSELAPWLAQSDVPVLSLQNGVDNEPMIARILGESRVLGGLAVRIGGHIVEPGVVEAEGVAQVVMGEWPAVPEEQDARRPLLEILQSAFERAGIPTVISDDIRYELWRKLVINNGVNPISALTGLDTQSLTRHPQFSRIVYGMMGETAAAAKADGLELGKADVDEMFELISSFNAIKTSMLVDKEKGRPLELDSIAGAVLRRSKTLGIDAPYTTTVNALLEHGLG